MNETRQVPWQRMQVGGESGDYSKQRDPHSRKTFLSGDRNTVGHASMWNHKVTPWRPCGEIGDQSRPKDKELQKIGRRISRTQYQTIEKIVSYAVLSNPGQRPEVAHASSQFFFLQKRIKDKT